MKKFTLAFFHSKNADTPYLTIEREFDQFGQAYEWFHATALENGFYEIQQDGSLAGAHRINSRTGEKITIALNK